MEVFVTQAFKLRTTNQSLFMVKPGTGLISPGRDAVITIVLVFGIQRLTKTRRRSEK
jgi:hypothetical protein